MAVISILAAILFPVFARARENARRTSCLSNLKQLGAAFQLYTQDYDERLPSATDAGSPSGSSYGEGKKGGWMYYSEFGVDNSDGSVAPAADFDPQQGSLFPYVKSTQVYICPSDSRGRLTKNSYAMNGCLTEAPYVVSSVYTGFHAGKSLAEFQNATLWMLLAEEASANSTITDSSTLNRTSTDDGYLNINYYHTYAVRHLGHVNLAFLDGHVKALTPLHVTKGGFMIGAKHGRYRPYFFCG
jgi:prepilin-type processing-associated H-X9-DG protein